MRRKERPEDKLRKTFAMVDSVTLERFDRIHGWGKMLGRWHSESEAFAAIIEFYFNENLRKAGQRLPEIPK